MAVGGVIQGGTFKMGLDIFALMLTLMLYRKVSDSHYYHDYAQNHNSTGIWKYFMSYWMYMFELLFVNIFFTYTMHIYSYLSVHWQKS